MELFVGYMVVWCFLVELVCKGYVGIMYLYKESLIFKVIYLMIGVLELMDEEGWIIILEFENFYLIEVYILNFGIGFK